jgi:hypothetical protein
MTYTEIKEILAAKEALIAKRGELTRKLENTKAFRRLPFRIHHAVHSFNKIQPEYFEYLRDLERAKVDVDIDIKLLPRIPYEEFMKFSVERAVKEGLHA